MTWEWIDNIKAKAVRRHPSICLALMAVAVLSQWTHHYYSAEIGKDQAIQIAGAQSWKMGRGFSLPRVYADDISRPVPQKIVGWPPGYSFLYLPVSYLVKDHWMASYLLDCAFIVLFFVFWYFILERLTPWITPLGKITLWIYWGLIYSPLMDCLSSGLIALSLYSGGLFFTLRSARDPQKWIAAAWAGLFVGASSAIRYAYWPLLAVPPLIFAALWFREGKKYALPLVVQSGVAGIIFLAVCLFQLETTDEMTFLKSYSEGLEKTYGGSLQSFYPENIKEFRPFPAQAFGVQHGWYKMLQLMGVPPAFSPGLVWLTAIVIFFCVFRYAVQRFRAREGPLIDAFLIGAAGTSVLTVLMLVILALKYSALDTDNFLHYLRYYAPVFPFFTVLLVMLIFGESFKEFRSFRVMRRASTPVLIFCFVSVGYWRAKKWKLFLVHAPAEVTATYNEESRAQMGLVAGAVEEGRIVVFMDKYGMSPGLAVLSGASVMYPNSRDFESLRTERLVRVVAALEKPPVKSDRLFARFIRRRKGVKMKSTKGFDYYAVDVEPGSAPGETIAIEAPP